MKRTSRKSFNHRPLCPNSCLHFLETVSDSGESEYGSQEKYGCIILKLLCTKFHAFCYLVFSLFIIFWFSLLKLDNQWVIIGFIISITNILVFTLQFMFIALIESVNVFFSLLHTCRKYYLDVQRREDGFDLSGPCHPREDPVPLRAVRI